MFNCIYIIPLLILKVNRKSDPVPKMEKTISEKEIDTGVKICYTTLKTLHARIL